MQIDFYASQRLSPRSLEVVKAAKVAVFGDSPVRLNPVERKSALHLDNGFLEDYPLAGTILERRFEAYKRHPFGEHTLYLDIESHSVEDRWRMPLEEFFRLGQWAIGDGPIETTTDVDAVLDLIRNAPGVVAHNGHAFDFSVLLGDEALVFGLDNRLFDTKVHAALALPAPYTYVDRNGHRHVRANKPEKAAQWLSLDNLCFQLGLPGKEGDLKALAKEFGGFGDIPTDDPRYLAYAVQDIDALRQLTGALLELYPLDGYAWREQQNAAIDAQNSRNGFCVDTRAAQERSDMHATRRDEVMSWLAEKYDFPTEGAMPWRSNKGKEALFKVLADHGITPETRPDWQKTASGAPSLGGDVLIELTQGTEAEELGRVLAEVMGLRSLPDLALSRVQPDGKVHPEISALQRSGRKCVPTSHRILTRRGVLSWDEVRVGDYTLDASNEWARVLEVHHYEDAVTDVWSNSRDTLECTPEHKWLMRTETGTRSLAPIRDGMRRTLCLTPDAKRFELRRHTYPSELTHREQCAALAGLLVTDGRAAAREDNGRLRSFVYQTEGKFYQQMRGVIPEGWVLGDRVTDGGGHHEISLKNSFVEQFLSGEGLGWRNGLRHDVNLPVWVASLTEREALCFLVSCYLSDGNVSQDDTLSISCKNPVVRDAIMIAGYRAGYRPGYSEYRNETHHIDAGKISLRRDAVGTRNLTRSSGRGDVWCVTTESGTWTAWNNAPYLTGNSTTKPGLTVWGAREGKDEDKAYFIASPGRKLVEVDYSNADQRILAGYSGDTEYLKRFEEGVDGHEINGRIMFGDEVYDSDPKKYRTQAKAPGHAFTYGAGAGKLAATTGLPIETMQRFVEGMNAKYPELAAWTSQVRKDAACGFVTNWWGRRMLVDRGREHSQAPALMGQSGTREIMVDSLIRLARFDLRLVQWLVAQVHDALVFDIPEEHLEWAMTAIKACMEVTWGPGQPVEFNLSVGKPADNWREAGH